MTRTRRRLLLAAAGLAAIIAVLVIGPGAVSGPPLDPRSTAPQGTRGLLDVLRTLGVDVDLDGGSPDADDEVALVISDELTAGQREDLQDWVAAGGHLVLTDPLSELAPTLGGLTSIAFTEPTIEPLCEDPAVEGVERIAVLDGVVFALPEGAEGCFPRNGGFWMVREAVGHGVQVTLGGAFTLINELLDDADTAVLLVNLLTPAGGGGLHVVEGDASGAGDEGLLEVLPDQVTAALLQIPVIWLAAVWWRGRRHGRPVGEVPPVPLDAAETTVAVGSLLQRAGRAEEAAGVLRSHTTGEIRRRLGLDESLSGEPLAAAVSGRTHLEESLVRQVLLDPLPRDEQAYVRFAAATAQLRRAMTRTLST